MRVLTLYGKPGCCLCDDARAVLEQVRRELPFRLEQVDVSRDPGLMRRYGERTPVVAVDGEEAFELGLDAASLLRRLGRVGP